MFTVLLYYPFNGCRIWSDRLCFISDIHDSCLLSASIGQFCHRIVKLFNFFLKNQLIVSLIFFPIAVPFSISLIPLWIVSFFLLALGYFPLQF